MWQFFSPDVEKWITLTMVVIVFALILLRKVPIHWLSLGAAAVLIALGIISPEKALLDSGNGVNWDVLAIYFGYGMLALPLMESKMPAAISNWILPKLRKEKYALLFLCTLSAFLSSFMANPVVVIILAPLAIEMAERLKSSLFLYLVGLAISSNVVTTVSMVADPPALILAMQTNMTFLDFYWFHSRPSLGTLTVVGVLAALLTLLFQFRRLNNAVDVIVQPVRVAVKSVILIGVGGMGCAVAIILNILGLNTAAILFLLALSIIISVLDALFPEQTAIHQGYLQLSLGPAAIFVLSIFALALVPNATLGFLKYQGWVGLILGILALLMLGRKWFEGVKEFDWVSIAFLIGIFIVIGSVNQVGLLKDFSNLMIGIGLTNPLVVFVIITWLSVALSSFIDNVPYTVLMIPVCSYMAQAVGVNPFYFYFGMLVGTGIGGNITPVGATANVLACGMLEKRGYKINLGTYMKISIPFSCLAVLAVMILIQVFWSGF
ncbi:MAG: SLC13 family permease [Desulfobacterales bacterium]|nr:SLC13 family permease [Desulfobacterales bacterium]